MRTLAQLRKALGDVKNVSKFAEDNKLPPRTVWRIRAGEVTPRLGTHVLIDAALNKK